ncbi:hypothetical protein [Sphingomonas mollis]|uniref:EF-hand domain-containing protein n=1 Tax=Sphingomonas mollis TaxID=2795726 RepID=A0ABS0XSI1_9SPHN|nr:hypothetical protein [Sphingomonas sp. BT553]MBJ6122982.1 hypothetical protein [Sphingomonas sp. BT553]
MPWSIMASAVASSMRRSLGQKGQMPLDRTGDGRLARDQFALLLLGCGIDKLATSADRDAERVACEQRGQSDTGHCRPNFVLSTTLPTSGS